jgi:tetratricopeptide (TPR) repeat protein
MGLRRNWWPKRFPWARSRSSVECTAAECKEFSDGATQSSTSDRDPHLMDLIRQVIALRQSGDVQGSLDLIDRSFAEGISSNYLLDNRARALSQLNCEREAIQIWEALSKCGDLELQEKSKRLIYQYKCRSVLQHVVQLSQQGHANEALSVLDVARAEGIENDMLLDNRARVLVQLNRHVEAMSIWRQLSQSDPKKYNAILISQLVGALQLICRSQGWHVQHFDKNVETLDQFEGGVLQECELLSGYGYTKLLIKLVEQALESGFESPLLALAKANALIELEQFVDAKNFLNHSKESVRDQHVLAIMEDILDTLSRDVEAELVVGALVPLKAKGDLDAAQNLLVQALLQNHSCVLYEEKLQELLVERGEKNPEHQAFELFLGEAERIRDAASMSSQ